MNRLYENILLLFFIGFFSLAANATHNRAGEIRYEQIGPLTIRATIVTYTKASSTAADRDTLILNWGDGSEQNVGRSNGNGNGEPIAGQDLKINLYVAEHTYPGRDTYTLWFQDLNRVADIINLNFPNSVEIPFYVQTTFTLLNSNFQGYNSSAQLLQPPIDFACIFKKFEHNPNAYDPDGDSLAYELVVPFDNFGNNVPNYLFPTEILPGPSNVITLDEFTGDFVWDAPQTAAEYSIAILIKEYRDGILITSTVRDMQIFVQQCENNPPIVESDQEICVIAGELLEIPITVNDPDEDQLVQLSYTGGPFILDISPAEVIGNPDFQEVSFDALFRWQTQCDHASGQAYQVVLKGQDNFGNTGFGLADIHTITIRVIAPPPLEVDAEVIGETVEVSWEKPYECEVTQDSFFIGFSVWRRFGSNPFPEDSCKGGLDNRGYQKVGFNTTEFVDDRYQFVDENIPEQGILCYRVLAQFAPRTATGAPYNLVESMPSMEVCLQLSGDIPLITNVSVIDTDVQDGSIEVKWIKPDPRILDTLDHPGPYRYELERSADNGQTFQAVPNASFEAPLFSDPLPLAFVDRGLNTENNQFYYRINFIVTDSEYGISEKVSSVYLSAVGTDKRINLNWKEDVPWENYEYTIYKMHPDSNSFDSLTTIQNQEFIDQVVENGLEYCYYIEAVGTYGLTGIPSPLINNSQIVCTIPIDSIPPCAPELMVDNPCDEANPSVDVDDFFNQLTWSNPSATCERSMDVIAYNIYFASTQEETLTLIQVIDDQDITRWEHLPEIGINGCYAISAIDSLGNESMLSDVVCVDNCPIYILPNTFTPNGDGANEQFIPIENRFVETVDFKILNRWGNLIFETTDPTIQWDGRDLGGTLVDDGVYYYNCAVFEKTISGTIEQRDQLSGFIQVISK